jgi:hypothetical protein
MLFQYQPYGALPLPLAIWQTQEGRGLFDLALLKMISSPSPKEMASLLSKFNHTTKEKIKFFRNIREKLFVHLELAPG